MSKWSDWWIQFKWKFNLMNIDNVYLSLLRTEDGNSGTLRWALEENRVIIEGTREQKEDLEQGNFVNYGEIT